MVVSSTACLASMKRQHISPTLGGLTWTMGWHANKIQRSAILKQPETSGLPNGAVHPWWTGLFHGELCPHLSMITIAESAEKVIFCLKMRHKEWMKLTPDKVVTHNLKGISDSRRDMGYVKGKVQVPVTLRQWPHELDGNVLDGAFGFHAHLNKPTSEPENSRWCCHEK